MPLAAGDVPRKIPQLIVATALSLFVILNETESAVDDNPMAPGVAVRTKVAVLLLVASEACGRPVAVAKTLVNQKVKPDPSPVACAVIVAPG